jgi:hypothetical protein
MRILIALACLMLSLPALAEGPREIRFPRGASEATVGNSVIRADRDLYTATARAGQTMRVRITSVERNAVFQIFRPGARFEKVDEIYEFDGQALSGTSEEDAAMSWSGTLPQSGKYLIVVGGTRGNATYRLTVSIR